MPPATPALLALTRLGIDFETRNYLYDPDAAQIGLHAAAALGEPARRVLKTLVVKVDGAHACVVTPSDRTVSMKKVAAAFNAKTATMASPADAERLTGYKIGGVSPFGQKRTMPVVLESLVTNEAYVWVNAGRRGLQVRLRPADLCRGTNGAFTDLMG